MRLIILFLFLSTCAVAQKQAAPTKPITTVPADSDSVKYVEILPVFLKQLDDIELQKKIQEGLLNTRADAIVTTIVVNKVNDFSTDRYTVERKENYYVVALKKALKPSPPPKDSTKTNP